MFCPNCGNNCGDANFCSNCGQDLRRIVTSNPFPTDNSCKSPDMDEYYRRYKDNRMEAVAALQVETGMSSIEAVNMINYAFDMRQGITEKCNSYSYDLPMTKREKKKEMDRLGQVYCPKCLSTSISANQKGFGFVRGALGASVGLDVGMIAGGIGSKKVVCTCLKCGYQWKPGKK